MSSLAIVALPFSALPKWKIKSALVALLIIGALFLLPTLMVQAEALGGYVSEKVIGRDGVNDSSLIVGRDGVNNSSLDIVMGGIHFNPNDPAFLIVSLAPLLYVALGIVVILGLFIHGHISFKTLIIAGVAIYLLAALLPGIQEAITGLLR